jgi:hypothetical protein
MCLFAKQTYGTAHKSFNFAESEGIKLPLIEHPENAAYRGGDI